MMAAAVIPIAHQDAYAFRSAFPPDHFVSQMISYCSERTDAAHEFHEAHALALLAAALPGVRADLAPYPNGLPANLYLLAVGNSTDSRKSTTQGLTRDIQLRALPDSVLSELSSPEAFTEQLAAQRHRTWIVDEMGEMLVKLQTAKHLSGQKALLLTLYGGEDYTYQRVAKRTAAHSVEDKQCIVAPHLNVIGAATPAMFEQLTRADVMNGLIPRFAIVWPEHKPVRRPFYQVSVDAGAKRSALVVSVAQLRAWAIHAPRLVRFEQRALEFIDEYAENLEGEAATAAETCKPLLQRLPPMAIKVSMLAAAGRVDAINYGYLPVTVNDAIAAVSVVSRWRDGAMRFAARVGENEFEREVQRCARLVKQRGTIPRRFVARNAHLSRRQLDEVKDTLVDRGLITVIHVPAPSGPTTEEWSWCRDDS
jgi:hypothetical protein